MESVIEVRGISKAFVAKNKRKRLFNILIDRAPECTHQVLNNISFTVAKGEALAIIGKNGCGKSTTLKLLTGILKPDAGNIVKKGRTASLIELGAGFHPELSGRENIYINASIYGIKKREIDKQLESIIAFSELENFIDEPVRTYSSGMYMRLAFSVAINVHPNILLVDEILAVGDAAFQEKCFERIRSLKAEGVTIVLVSHSLGQVRSVCDRAIWLEAGSIRMDGGAEEVCSAYIEDVDAKRLQKIREDMLKRNKSTDQYMNRLQYDTDRPYEECIINEIDDYLRSSNSNITGNILLKKVELLGRKDNIIRFREKLRIRLSFECIRDVRELFFRIICYRCIDKAAVGVTMSYKPIRELRAGQTYEEQTFFDSSVLAPGKYALQVVSFSKNDYGEAITHEIVKNTIFFRIVFNENDFHGFQWLDGWGNIVFTDLSISGNFENVTSTEGEI